MIDGESTSSPSTTSPPPVDRRAESGPPVVREKRRVVVAGGSIAARVASVWTRGASSGKSRFERPPSSSITSGRTLIRGRPGAPHPDAADLKRADVIEELGGL